MNIPNTEAMNPSAGIPLQPIVVVAVDGPSRGARARLEAGSLRVGSGDACDLVLDDRSVSRLHLTAQLHKGSVVVRDAGSRNGTVYLGARVTEARIPVGGSVTVGRTTLRFAPVVEDAEPARRDELHGLTGSSLAMRRLFQAIERIGPTDTTLLITGEVGTGKERAARAVHAVSANAHGAFVVFDCAAVNAELMESELFGHARGAFSGADRPRAGALELAAGGTLFLDQVGELPLHLQPKLLRALDQREYRRIGDGATRRITARFIAASHKDLDAAAKAGHFRLDLFYRLAVATLEVPPLRERLEDVALLAVQLAREMSNADVTLSQQTLAALQCDTWKGNVRELRNVIARIVAMGGAAGQPLPDLPGRETPYRQARELVVERFERDYLKALVAAEGGNLSAAGRTAGISRTQLYRMLKRHGLA